MVVVAVEPLAGSETVWSEKGPGPKPKPLVVTFTLTVPLGVTDISGITPSAVNQSLSTVELVYVLTRSFPSLAHPDSDQPFKLVVEAVSEVNEPLIATLTVKLAPV